MHDCKDTDCDTLVLTCVDFRFCRKAIELVSWAGCRDLDLLTFPGAAKAVVEENTRDAILQAIETIKRVHNTKRIILIDHVDCAACGGSAGFGSVTEEKAYHVDRLREAAAVLSEKHPSIEIIPAYMDWDQLQPLELTPEISQGSYNQVASE
jgi:carbonic anhydrase